MSEFNPYQQLRLYWEMKIKYLEEQVETYKRMIEKTKEFG